MCMADAKHQSFVHTLLELYIQDGVDLQKVLGWLLHHEEGGNHVPGRGWSKSRTNVYMPNLRDELTITSRKLIQTHVCMPNKGVERIPMLQCEYELDVLTNTPNVGVFAIAVV